MVVIEAAARQNIVAAITISELFLAEQIIPIFTCADILFNI